jgi:hypothetical protein
MSELKKRRLEIRITDPEPTLFEQITSLAKKEKRSVAKQAEFILEQFFTNQKAL